MAVEKTILRHTIIYNSSKELDAQLEDYTKELSTKIKELKLKNVTIRTEIREATFKEIMVKTTVS
jgi:hypothetical protein